MSIHFKNMLGTPFFSSQQKSNCRQKHVRLNLGKGTAFQGMMGLILNQIMLHIIMQWLATQNADVAVEEKFWFFRQNESANQRLISQNNLAQSDVTFLLNYLEMLQHELKTGACTTWLITVVIYTSVCHCQSLPP
jgi:hypothetical protein